MSDVLERVWNDLTFQGAEIDVLCCFLSERRPSACRREHVVLEVGSAHGGSLLRWLRLDPRRIVSVDIERNNERTAVINALTEVGVYDVREVIGDSTRLATKEAVKAALVEEDGLLPVTCLFIDGNHSYEYVKSDFEMYTDLLAPDAVIALHDIRHVVGCDVPRLWREISERAHGTETTPPNGWTTIEIIETSHTKGVSGHGIGVVLLGGAT